MGRLKEQGTGKGKGRKREEKGKGKGRERERKQPKLTERGDYFLSEKIPKQNRNCQCFRLFRFEPKEKKSVSQDTLVVTVYPLAKFLCLCLCPNLCP